MSMTIKDLHEGMTCTIISTKKNGKYESRTSIQKIEKNTIYVKPTVIDGRVVQLRDVANYLVIDIKGREPQVFQYVHPEVYKYGGKTYYRIDLKNKISVKYNRRHNYRCSIGKPVFARADKNVATHPCIVKNISAVGFALVFSQKDLPLNYKEVKTFHCVFNDYNPKFGLNTTIELDGQVRRIVETKDGRVLFGCQIPYSSKIDRYVAKKIEISRARG